MLNALMRLGFSLPKPLSLPLLSVLWSRFWDKERRDSSRESGQDLPDLSQSERAILIKEICRHYPLENILELGAGYAQNFHILGRLLPKTSLVGLEIDPRRVEGGQAFLLQREMKNARLIQGDACDLRGFADRSFDIVCSCGFLLYLEPAKLRSVLLEAARVGRRAVVLLEQHIEGPESRAGVPRGAEKPYWLHDYQRVCREIFPGHDVKVVPVPRPVWSTEEWRKLAHLIVVKLHNSNA